MPRLKFFAFLFLALALLPRPAAADPRSAAAALFDDPVEREAFFAMMAADKDLTAAVAEAEKTAQAKGGAEPKAVAAALNELPAAAGWKKNVLDQLTKTHDVLRDALKKNPTQTKFPTAPLVDPLMKSLNRQNPADLYVGIGALLEKRGVLKAPPPAATKPACATGPQKALDLARTAAATGEMTGVTGECAPAPAAPLPPTKPKDPKEVLTPPAQVPPVVTDQRTTTGAPPSPGADKEKGPGGGGGFLSSLWNDGTKAGLGLGAALGMVFGFGTPIGWLGGALIGAAIGGVVCSGVIGKVFGGLFGGKKDS